ncbi:hypothetical protein HII31_07354 [Pseudocercospora fuligena]|uniref:Apple domain-containing protein n=1 Tax=Pseudocercospora fuligena TaxID=685502 RepID=A0A8H6RJR9_9PEZI|nr:hypothetical protein HII31_07354 [Pseudocercospora fuligena]
MSLLRLLLALVTLTGLTLAQNSFSCANNDRTVITDSNGVQYIMRCGSDTTLASTIQSSTQQGFNDCFSQCSGNCLGTSCAPCAGFTFSGSQNSNGTGAGTCYYKQPASSGYNGFSGDGNWAVVGAIKMQYYPPMPPAFQCPAQDLNVVTDPNFGYQYVLGCGRETFGGSAGNPLGVADSFNDCFLLCATFPGPGNCTAFTYSGGVNGVGSGMCYFKNVNSNWVWLRLHFDIPHDDHDNLKSILDYIHDYNCHNQQVNCGQYNIKASYAQGGTNTRGISACFRGCDKRPSCVGFYYSGTAASGTGYGAGQCYYQLTPLDPTWATSTTYYAGAVLISNGTPQLPCPYYNGSTYVDTAGNSWGVLCGYDGGTGYSGFQAGDSMVDCFNACNSYTDPNSGAPCTYFVFNYGGAEPQSITGGTGGSCFVSVS